MTHRELTYKIYGDDKLSGKLQRISSAGNKTDRSLGKLDGKLSRVKMGMRDAASEVPGLSRGLRLLSNPITLAAGAVVGLAYGFDKMTKAAENFDENFRELLNLNMDKSPLERSMLRASVLQTAYQNGFDPNKTSKAYYDVQSITAKYGAEVDKIVAKVGMFSRIMKSDFNVTIAGTAQAMDIYKLKASDLNKYLESLNATVQVGKVNFDELTQEQVRYANAAAAAGQNYNNANRLFAVFSKLSNHTRIAARYTKIAFEDLTKSTTLKAFKKVGVTVYDAHQKMLGVDKIVEELVPKLKKMSDMQFNNFKNSLGGSLGAGALLSLIRNKADLLLNDFKLFDNTKFHLADSLKEANKSAEFLHETMKNKLQVDMIRLGEVGLPILIKGIEILTTGLDKLDTIIKGKSAVKKEIDNQDSYNLLKKYQPQLAIADKLPQDKFNTIINGLYGKIQTERNILEAYPNTNLGVAKFAKVQNMDIGSAQTELTDFRNRHYKFEKEYKKILGYFSDYRKNPTINPYHKPDKSVDGNGSPIQNYKDGLAGISGGGSKVTSVTVTIGKLNENINISTTTLNESGSEIEKKMTEFLIRSIAGAEQIINN